MQDIAGISTNAMAKLGRDQDVRVAVLEKICSALDCKIEDIVEIQNDDKTSTTGRIDNRMLTLLISDEISGGAEQ